MKILFVTHRYPPRTGGVETHVREIATRLVERGHEVTVFSADAGNDVSQDAVDEGVRVRRFRSLSPNGVFYLAPQLAIEVRRANADIIHAHNYHAFPLLFAALGVKNERLVMTTHYHGGSANAVRNRLLSIYRWLGRWAIEQADEVIAVSGWEREQLASDLDIEARVIPNGLNIDRFREAEPMQHTNPYLLSVGRLEEYKGVHHVIQLLPEISGYDLLVAGSGPYQEELERLTEEVDVGDRVNFLGYVDEEVLPRLYAGAEAYVSLSNFEAYGMTIPEALAAGTPCVVLRRAALNDWASYSGVIGVNTTSPDELRNSILAAINTDIGEIDLPTWDTVTSELEIVYND